MQAANRAVTVVRRREQNDLFGHRGRKGDPLYQTRKLLLSVDEKLDDRGRTRLLEGLRFGDPNDEVLSAWLAKEMIRDVYLTDDIELAEKLLTQATKARTSDSVPEIRKLGKMLTKWVTEILNHHRTGASNGPSEGLNLLIKKPNESGMGSATSTNYRLRILLFAGGCDWSKLANPETSIRKRKTLLK